MWILFESQLFVIIFKQPISAAVLPAFEGGNLPEHRPENRHIGTGNVELELVNQLLGRHLCMIGRM